jgi:EPS-associated MarR family transcriptional regulator
MKDRIIIKEDELDVMHLIEKNPKISQRSISKKSGFSIGKVNYCLKALIDLGHIKLINYKNSSNKSSYMYILTPKGIKEKLKVTKKFIRKKQEEYNKLTSYIDYD